MDPFYRRQLTLGAAAEWMGSRPPALTTLRHRNRDLRR